MLIRDMFVKDIDRDIKGVVKIGQDDEANIRQELEEYVVTTELQKHFRDFFSAYTRSIKGETDNMGVWISGFFGSGKSHLLKILSYLVGNKEIDGKRAVQYFEEDHKIQDPMVLADMRLATTIKTDAILFNIDSKSDTAGPKGKDEIVRVFLKVFNEMQGYYGADPYVADLERELEKQGKYDDFKLAYRDLSGSEWLESRNKFKFKSGRVKDALVKIGFMDEQSADNWIEYTKRPYAIAIEDFAELVREYIEAQGDNHHVVFFVDEVGQYIGDDTDLMLNLQTVTEDLGTACKGKAWVVVTSQAAIDSISEVKGDDFSKITGRFATRINLTSTDVDEVIKKRILEKTPVATQTLTAIYENKESTIHNLITFNDGIEKKNYANAADFAEVYPFIPYQFNLLGSVLTSVRQHSSSGKHLSDGERSMLALFKESAEQVKDEEDGVLVSFDKFYDGLDEWLDHNHATVVSHASQNEFINPHKEADCFTVNVLKALFLIKYVKEIEANVDNITTLMISDIDTDRAALKEQVQESLDMLVRQTLVQKNGSLYIFLTDTEQEVERQIKNQHVESAEIAKRTWMEIFENIYREKKYQYPALNGRYTFSFDQFVDDYAFGKTGNDIKVRIFTPRSGTNGNNEAMRLRSAQENAVYVSLPENNTFINEMSQAIRIEKFLQSSEAKSLPNVNEIRSQKNSERIEHQNRASRALENSLQGADFYVNGGKLQFKSMDFNNALTEALGKVVKLVYQNLDFITVAKNENDVRNLFRSGHYNNTTLSGETSRDNERALNAVMVYVGNKTDKYTKISLKEVMDKFMAAPFGFLEVDVRWLVAQLFTEGSLELTLNGNAVSLMNNSGDEIADFILKKSYVEKLLLSVKEAIDPAKINALKSISRSILKRELTTDDTDTMVIQFNEAAQRLKQEISDLLQEYKYQPGVYPGKAALERGLKHLNQTLSMNSPKDIFDYVAIHQEDYKSFFADYEPIRKFFSGTQRDFWEKASANMRIYDESTNYFVDDDLAQTMERMGEILNMVEPYDHIKDLPALNEAFKDRYFEILEAESAPVEDYIERTRADVLEYLEQFNFADKYRATFSQTFNSLRDKVRSSHNIKDVHSYQSEALLLRDRFMVQIDDERENNSMPDEPVQPDIPVKIHKALSLSSLIREPSCTLESEADVDRLTEDLNAQLRRQLGDNQVLTIRFK